MNVFDEELPVPNLLRSDNHIETESDHTDEHGWSHDLEKQLENIKENAIQQSKIAKKQYLELVYIQKYFKIPVIVISSLNSIASISLSAWMSQNSVSLTTCFLSFVVATMGSIELYLGIARKIDVAYQSYQHFYLLSVRIQSCLKLEREHRNELDGKKFLCDALSEYETLFSQNNVTYDNYDDFLLKEIELIEKK
jgi:hypothetical protein